MIQRVWNYQGFHNFLYFEGCNVKNISYFKFCCNAYDQLNLLELVCCMLFLYVENSMW